MRPEMTADLLSLGTAAAALLGVLGMILLAARLLRGLPRLRAGAGRTTAHLRITDTLALDPRRRLHRLECDGHAILILTGGTTDIMVPIGHRE